MLAAALTMRVLFLVAYRDAFYFPDSQAYVHGAAFGYPSQVRPYGYSLFLKPFVDSLGTVVVLQHLIGLALVVAGYLFLVRRGVKPWVAALAVLPVALDARELTLEHYILAETLYIALTAAGLMLLAWRDRLGAVAAAIGGLLLGAAALTRTVGLPILALVVLYLLIRRVGWRPLAAFALPVLALLGGYLAWYHSEKGVYAFGEYQGRFLYSRVMPIADCDKLDLTAKQRTLCMPAVPAGWDQKPDNYIWDDASPAKKLYPDAADDGFLNSFATAVIEQEPGRFVTMVAGQTAWHLQWHPSLGEGASCLAGKWVPPASPGAQCEATYYLPTPQAGGFPAPTVPATNHVGAFLNRYADVATLPGAAYLIGLLIAVFAAFRGDRRLDSLLFTAAGFGLIVVSVATSMFDHRYALPAVLLIPLGTALGVTRILEHNARAEAELAAAGSYRTNPAYGRRPPEARAS